MKNKKYDMTHFRDVCQTFFCQFFLQTVKSTLKMLSKNGNLSKIKLDFETDAFMKILIW